MNEQAWKRKEYESWDEAFRGLSPIVRQQSVRIAAYTRALFSVACQLHFGAGTKAGEERMRGTYADLSYKCGMYHQLGKALVPHEYQIWQEDFSDEEKNVYKKYTSDGRILVSCLQQRGARSSGKRKGRFIEVPTHNIPWLMLREVCEQHMERYDGSGYPKGLAGDAISPIAQIVGLAKELDRIASETKSETPFEIAVEAIKAGAGKDWSEALVAVFEASIEDCRAVYEKYIAYTRTLPKTIPLVEKRADRKMGLKFRPMVSDMHGTVTMYEAIPWFAGIVDQPDETEGVEDLRELFKRTSLIEDISWLMMYEAADAVVRINNCKLNLKGVFLEMIPEFYSSKTHLQKLNQLFVDQPIEKDQLWLTLPVDTFKKCNKKTMEIIERYLRNGIVLVLDGYRPDDIPPEKLLEIGLTHVRLDPALYLNHDTAETIIQLHESGFTVIGGGADTPDILAWLVACGIEYSSGTMTGNTVDEDELILDSLQRESKVW